MTKSFTVWSSSKRRAQRGPSTFDVSHRFVLSGLYELPFGKGKKFGAGVGQLAQGLAGGWQLNTITTPQGGLPFTPTLATSALNNGNWQLPSRICHGWPPSGERGPQRWFDTGCFASPGVAAVLEGYVDVKLIGREPYRVRTLEVHVSNNGQWRMTAHQSARIAK